jgi:hypothetical protein
LERGARWRVAAVEEGMQEDPLHPLAAGQFQQPLDMGDVAMDSSIGDQTEEVERSSGLLGVTACGDQRSVLIERTVGNRPGDPLDVLVDDAAGAEVQMSYLRVAEQSGRQTHVLTRGGELSVRGRTPEPVPVRRTGEMDGVVRTGGCDAETVQDAEHDGDIAGTPSVVHFRWLVSA